MPKSPLVLVLYEESVIDADDVWSVMASIRDRAGLRFDDRSVPRDDRPMVWVYSSPQPFLAALRDGRVREWLAVSGREVVGFAEHLDPTVPALLDQFAKRGHVLLPAALAALARLDAAPRAVGCLAAIVRPAPTRGTSTA